jgi:hypothetical protein
MTAQTLIFISVLTILFFGSCNKTPDLTEDEVYTIINEIIADDSLHINKVCSKFQEVVLTTEMKKEFTKEDLEFISRQKALFKDQVIKSGKLKWLHNPNKTFVSTLVDTACNNGILYHVSFPIISTDRQKVLIEFQQDCNCMLGGQGGQNLYEKKNGHWIRTNMFNHWISFMTM